MKNRVQKEVRTPEQLASFLADGHRVWIKGHLYEVFKRPANEDGFICDFCNNDGRCTEAVNKVCSDLKPDQFFRYGLRRIK